MDELIFTNLAGEECKVLFTADRLWIGCMVKPPYLKTPKQSNYLWAYLAARHSQWIGSPAMIPEVMQRLHQEPVRRRHFAAG